MHHINERNCTYHNHNGYSIFHNYHSLHHISWHNYNYLHMFCQYFHNNSTLLKINFILLVHKFNETANIYIIRKVRIYINFSSDSMTNITYTLFVNNLSKEGKHCRFKYYFNKMLNDTYIMIISVIKYLLDAIYESVEFPAWRTCFSIRYQFIYEGR